MAILAELDAIVHLIGDHGDVGVLLQKLRDLGELFTRERLSCVNTHSERGQAQALLLATDGTLPVGLCGVLRISARVRGVIAASKSLMSSLTSAALIFPSSDAVAGRNGTNFGTPPAICTVAGSAAQRR